MPAPPQDAKNLTGFEPFGVDTNGNNAFFGFTLENSPRVILHCDHHKLGTTIRYLQAVATEAQQRRIRVNPTVQDVEARDIGSIVQQVGAVAGQWVALQGTRTDGLNVELALPYELAEKLLQKLPKWMKEMRKRQKAKMQQH